VSPTANPKLPRAQMNSFLRNTASRSDGGQADKCTNAMGQLLSAQQRHALFTQLLNTSKTKFPKPVERNNR
jgi:hypothetical protein